MSDEVLTIKEVAEYLKVNERTIYRLAASGELPGFRVGNAWRFKSSELEAWVAQQTEHSKKSPAWSVNMDQQTNRELQQLIKQLAVMPKTATNLFSEHKALWQVLNFSQAQMALWLASLPLHNQQQEAGALYQAAPDITEHLLALLQQAGGRMPLAQALKKLPAGVTISEQHIRKLAQQHAQLDIKGPLLVLVN